MIDFEVMNMALKIVWIKRIRQNSYSSWKTLTEHFFRDQGGLSFLLNFSTTLLSRNIKVLGRKQTHYLRGQYT